MPFTASLVATAVMTMVARLVPATMETIQEIFMVSVSSRKKLESRSFRFVDFTTYEIIYLVVLYLFDQSFQIDCAI